MGRCADRADRPGRRGDADPGPHPRHHPHDPRDARHALGHGVRFADPLGRTREYVDIVTKALRRETLTYEGKHWTLPLPDGPGKALRLTVHPVRERLPIYLAAVGPRNLQLAGEIADGWLAIFYSPELAKDQHAALTAGAVTAGRGTPGQPLAGFDVVPTVPVVIDDDLAVAAEPLRHHAALYVGGMGSREQNFYNALAVRMGFEKAAAEVQDLYLARRHRDAAAAVPPEFIDRTALIGPRARVRDRMVRYAEAGVTTLSIAPYAATLEQRLHVVRTMAELLDETGLAD